MLYFMKPAFLPKPLLRAEFEISPKDTAEENGNPNPQNFCFHFPSPFEISTLAERSGDIKIKKNVERIH